MTKVTTRSNHRMNPPAGDRPVTTSRFYPPAAGYAER
jgi:hypothetical protein